MMNTNTDGVSAMSAELSGPDDCSDFLKDGETPRQRIERERKDTDAALSLLIREKQRSARMKAALEHIATNPPHAWKIAQTALLAD